jgi:hypothetical protein
MTFLLTTGRPNAVVELVDEDQVAHQKRRNHRAGRNLERLEQERPQQEDDQDDGEQAGGPVEPPRLHQHRLARRRHVVVDLRDALPRQLFASRRVLAIERCAATRRRGAK